MRNRTVRIAPGLPDREAIGALALLAVCTLFLGALAVFVGLTSLNA